MCISEYRVSFRLERVSSFLDYRRGNSKKCEEVSKSLKAHRQHRAPLTWWLSRGCSGGGGGCRRVRPIYIYMYTYTYIYIHTHIRTYAYIYMHIYTYRHGASCCWTEMYYSQQIVDDPDYLRASLHSCAEDRPLIVQICGNSPEVMAAAAVKIEEYCNTSLHGLDAIDINLGCPQKRAQDGHYGSYVLRTATRCNTLQRTAMHCNALQRTATHCNALQRTATHCNALQRTATHRNAVQHTAKHHSTLQHSATPCTQVLAVA